MNRASKDKQTIKGLVSIIEKFAAEKRTNLEKPVDPPELLSSTDLKTKTIEEIASHHNIETIKQETSNSEGGLITTEQQASLPISGPPTGGFFENQDIANEPVDNTYNETNTERDSSIGQADRDVEGSTEVHTSIDTKVSAAAEEPYPGDVDKETKPANSEYKTLALPDCAALVSMFDSDLREQTLMPDGIRACLHPWQIEVAEELAQAKATQLSPHKFCLCAANGSGKDKYIIAPFCIWFAVSKVRSRVIITSSSGVQLASQTESYIRDLAQKVNNYFGEEVFKVRQRYIYCNWSGSEIRLFATDEKGKAEGYHPWDLTSEMAIIVNEGKTVTDEIHNALRRCTGYNYWLEVSTPGEPKGFFHNAFTTWEHTRRVTSYDCPHLSKQELESDRIELGEDSADFRSKHLALFTSIGGQTIIPIELVNQLVKNRPSNEYKLKRGRSVGIDVAAGGDENALCIIEGNKCLKEYSFKERDTTITTARFKHILEQEKIPYDYQHIYCDHGGISQGVLDQLRVSFKNINGIHNQWAALGSKKQYGNRGAENWYRIKRLFEEHIFDAATLGIKTRQQLTSRHYKQNLVGARILLESKKEAKAHGRPSPDRADAFILALTGLTIEDYLAAEKIPNNILNIEKQRGVVPVDFAKLEEAYDEVTYKQFDAQLAPRNRQGMGKRLYNSLKSAIGN